MEYGIIVYDVPVSRKRVYSKLRQKLRTISVQVTWSVYLTPYAMRDKVLATLKELDEDEDKADRIMYKYLKFDSSEREELDQLVRDEFEKMVKKAKDNLHQSLGEAEVQFMDGNLTTEDKALLQRGDLRKAAKKIKEARKLAMVFDVTNIMEAGFQAVEKLVEARREEIKDELKKAREDKEAKEANEEQ